MKLVIKKLERPTNIVELDNLGIKDVERFFYGVEYTGTYRGFITRRRFNHGEFIIRLTKGLTNGDEMAEPAFNTLYALLEHLVKHGGIKVYQFETSKELFDWIHQ